MISVRRTPRGNAAPAERELARQMQVSRAVVNGGLAELAQQGFLEVRPRQGTFVADYRRKGNLRTLIAIMEYHGGVLGKDEIRSILEVRARWSIWRRSAPSATPQMKRWNAWGNCRRAIATAQPPPRQRKPPFRFQHELALILGNSILPLFYYSFKPPVITLWMRFCRLTASTRSTTTPKRSTVIRAGGHGRGCPVDRHLSG